MGAPARAVMSLQASSSRSAWHRGSRMLVLVTNDGCTSCCRSATHPRRLSHHFVHCVTLTPALPSPNNSRADHPTGGRPCCGCGGLWCPHRFAGLPGVEDGGTADAPVLQGDSSWCPLAFVCAGHLQAAASRSLAASPALLCPGSADRLPAAGQCDHQEPRHLMLIPRPKRAPARALWAPRLRFMCSVCAGANVPARRVASSRK